jgi:transposase
MARQGIQINRNVVTGWAGRGAGELAPIWRRMRDILLSGSHLFIDETEVHVLDPGRGRTKTGYFWAIARDGRPYGSQDPPIVVFAYAPGRGAIHGKRMLEGFAGIAQCDGYSVYKTLAKERPDSTSTVPLKKLFNFRWMRAAVRLLAPHHSVEASLWPLG